MIYELARNWRNGQIEEVKTMLALLLVEIIVYNYSCIAGLDDVIAYKVLRQFKSMSNENQISSMDLFDQKLFQELAVYAFS